MKFILALLSISSIFCIYSKSVDALTKTLYDGSGLPENDSPQWLTPGALLSSGFPTTLAGTAVAGGVQVDSNANSAEYSGYSNYNPLTSSFVNSSFPTLDQNSGYSIFFNVALDTANDFSDTNNNNRAAFSITAIGAGNEGIEIGFDGDQIFAQNSNFTQAETQSFTTSNSTDYQLAVSGNTYQLLADTGSGFSSVINGSLRTYNFDPTASNPPLDNIPLVGSFNPYEIPNFLFFGDNTGEAYGTFTLGEISVETVNVPFDVSPTLGLALIGIGIGVRKLYIMRSFRRNVQSRQRRGTA
ncbi:MAG: hypothetical protein QNJ32_20820 [Xenococcaceae cyanobacterium MO_167.B27]|nr:hypothetical protein [Xenococcaceae cyanobacterium MO_167.B27]